MISSTSNDFWALIVIVLPSNLNLTAAKIGELYPEEVETWYFFPPPRVYHRFLIDTFDAVPFPPEVKGHSTSPFVWIERGEDQKMEIIGGLDRMKLWAQRNFPKKETNPEGYGCLVELMDSAEPSYTWAFTYHSTLPPQTSKVRFSIHFYV